MSVGEYQTTSKTSWFQTPNILISQHWGIGIWKGFDLGALAQLSQERRAAILAGQHHLKARLGQQGPLLGSALWLLVGGLTWGHVGPFSSWDIWLLPE